MKKTTLLSLIMLIVAVGCQPAPTPTVPPTPVPPTTTPIPPTSTPVPSATATLIPPTATVTLPPTSTPTRTATPRPTGNLVVNMNFKDTSEPACEGGSYSFGQFYCQDGEYHMINKGTGSMAAWLDGKFSNFIIQAQMRFIGESGSYGVIFREQEQAPNCYIFRLRPSGQFQLIKWSSQGATLVPWTDSTAVKKGQATNLIEVIAQGTRLTLFVNGEQLASVTDASFAEGSVGPVATEQGHAIASTFKVWELPQ